MKKKVVVLGATGSIGRNAALELEAYPEKFEVVGLAARGSVDELVRQAGIFHPRSVVATDGARYEELASKLPPGSRALAGEEALTELVTSPDVDIVLCAIIGTAGIVPVLKALACGKRVALASKEVLCMAGELVMKAAKGTPGAELLPIDSEHSGVFQCLAGRRPEEVARLWLTASGGPFRTWSAEAIARATVEDALRHPTWNMGAKITIDSASLMNKALELVEARYLFGVEGDRLGAVIEPHSIVHALVELTDGGCIAQLAVPDMRLPIRYALSFPERLAGKPERFDFSRLNRVDFIPVDESKFPSLGFARQAIACGGTLPAVMNAANEVAVERFMRREVRFSDIWKIVGKTMARHTAEPQESLEQIREADLEARRFAETVAC
ncbi:MAG: 1-deoxy-D-xylulose-5-phosphate reductoisomerase [Lentisphaeria bacterium]|nr:1-deoxy-D-xylulose-5-phosphate reductoisomerase [Lentisphaeria bacterium]